MRKNNDQADQYPKGVRSSVKNADCQKCGRAGVKRRYRRVETGLWVVRWCLFCGECYDNYIISTEELPSYQIEMKKKAKGA